MLKTGLKPACFPLLPMLGNGTNFPRSPKHLRYSLGLILMTGDPEDPVPTKTTNNNNSSIHYFSAPTCQSLSPVLYRHQFVRSFRYYSNPLLPLYSYCQLPNSGACQFSSGWQLPPKWCPSLWLPQTSSLSSSLWQRAFIKLKPDLVIHYSVQNPCIISMGYRINPNSLVWWWTSTVQLSFYSPPCILLINHLDLLKHSMLIPPWTLSSQIVSADQNVFLYYMLSLEFLLPFKSQFILHYVFETFFA